MCTINRVEVCYIHLNTSFGVYICIYFNKQFSIDGHRLTGGGILVVFKCRKIEKKKKHDKTEKKNTVVCLSTFLDLSLRGGGGVYTQNVNNEMGRRTLLYVKRHRFIFLTPIGGLGGVLLYSFERT